MRHILFAIAVSSIMACDVAVGAETPVLPEEKPNCSLDGPPAQAPKKYSHGGVTQSYPNLTTAPYTGCAHFWLGRGDGAWWVKVSVYFESDQPKLCVIDERTPTGTKTVRCQYNGRTPLCPEFETAWECPSNKDAWFTKR